MTKIPSFIVDTDIGSDIDDMWALAYLLLINAPIDLIHVSHRNTTTKAKIVAKLLSAANRTDIPISIGRATDNKTTRMDKWVSEFDLNAYAGTVYKEGQTHLEHFLKEHPTTPILGLSPASSLGHVCDFYPELFKDRVLYQMAGSLKYGYEPNSDPVAEWNVAQDVHHFKVLLETKWKNIYIVPLDRCGHFMFTGHDYSTLKNSSNPIIKALIEGYSCWNSRHSNYKVNMSSRLFDLVTAYIMVEHLKNPNNIRFHPAKIIIDSHGHFEQDILKGKEILIPHPINDFDLKNQFLSLIKDEQI